AAEETIKLFGEFAALWKGVQTLTADFAGAQARYGQAVNAAEEQHRLYVRLNGAFLAEQAGILASRLAEGQPCPVCGSAHHPGKAPLAEDAPSEADVESARQRDEAARKQENRIGREMQEISGRLQASREQLTRRARQLLDTEDMEAMPAAYKERKAALNTRRAAAADAETEARQRAGKAQQLNRLIPQQEQKQAELAARLGSMASGIAEKQAACAQLTRQMGTLQAGLPYAGRREASAAAEELAGKAAALRRTLQQAEEQCQAHQNRRAALEGNIRALDEGRQVGERYDVQAEQNALDNLRLRKRQQQEEQQRLASRLEVNRRMLSTAQAQAEDLKRCEERRTWLVAMADTANGRLTGKDRVMLETYVQMTCFDRVLRYANTRLMVMTGGQYELLRRKEAASRQSYSGLELDVLDHYNGTTRSVASLSGGESFKASLALALGMSDAIQATAGGVQLDTMFVDEGFGSLDEESLEMALQALSSLSQGHRLVGLISHVNTLKERIDRRIVVVKAPSGGSHASIVAE
ncbi:MAG: SbcC/MukB-like Walker B domain-containing protein, partial [Aristaeellaceae bacterium]